MTVIIGSIALRAMWREDDGLLLEPLRARGADVVLAEHGDDRGAHEARDAGHPRQRHDEHWHDHVGAVDAFVAQAHQPQLEREQPVQSVSSTNDGIGIEEEPEADRQRVEECAARQRGVDADGDAQPEA